MYSLYKYNPYLLLINVAVWLILIIRYRRASSLYYSFHSSNGYGFFLVMAILYLVFAFSEADTYHYHFMFDEIKSTNTHSHIEPFYFWLIQKLPAWGYYIWRLIVWGMAICLQVLTFKRLGLDSDLASWLFALVLLVPFSLSRDALGFSLLTYSCSFIYKPGKYRLLSIVIGFLGVWLSSYLHKSMIVFIIIAILSAVRVGKLYYVSSFILFPFLYGVILVFSEKFLGLGILPEFTSASGMHYLESNEFKRNLNGIIQWVVTNTPLIFSEFILIKYLIFKNVKISKFGTFFFRISYNLIYIGLLFFGQDTSAFLSSRFLHASYFFLLIPLIQFYSLPERRNSIKTISLLYMISCAYNFAYHFYSYYRSW